MTRAQVEEAKKRCEGATPGPWTVMETPAPSREDHGWRAITIVGKRMIGVLTDQIWRGRTSRSALESGQERDANVELMAHARTDLPAALDMLGEAMFFVQRYREVDPHGKACSCNRCTLLAKWEGRG